jgi:hypothetical protein
MDSIVRRTKVVAALWTGLTTTGARVCYLWLTLDGNDLAPTSAAHIACPEVKGFNIGFVKSRIVERFVGSNEDYTILLRLQLPFEVYGERASDR